MPLRIACPEGHALIVSQARCGSTLRCPKCGAPVTIPGRPEQPAFAAANAAAVAATSKPSPRTPAAETAPFPEPEPPPVARPKVVEPPPVWSPPPKSRAVVEPAPSPTAPLQQPAAPHNENPQPGAAPQPQSLQGEIKEPDQPPAASAAIPSPAPESEPSAAVSKEESQPPAEIPVDEPPIAPPPLAQDQPAAVSPASPPLVIPTAAQRVTAYVLALALAAAALFGSGPAVWDVLQYSQAAAGGFVARWALVSLALAGVQIAYAIYFAQLPDWLSGWVVTLVALAVAALYAGMLGVTLFAGPESFLIRVFDLSDALANGRAAMWCLCMTTIMASLAFFAGRASLRWRRLSAALP